MNNKSTIRKTISQHKRAMTISEIEQKSSILTQQFLNSKYYRSADAVYAYVAINQEVRTLPLLSQILSDKKQLALPKIIHNQMQFVCIEDLQQLTPGYANIPEPIADTPRATNPHALVLTPGLAFDLQGHRIGYGGGFYDRFLAAEPHHPTLALCYDFQILPHIEPDPFDITVDCVLWA